MSLASGTTLGPYKIVSQLGSGRMGVVDKALGTHADRWAGFDNFKIVVGCKREWARAVERPIGDLTSVGEDKL